CDKDATVSASRFNSTSGTDFTSRSARPRLWPLQPPRIRRTVRMRSLARAIAVAGLVALLAAPATAQLPKSVTIGANPPGTGYYAVASGLAKVVTQATGMQMVVQPHSGTSTMLPLLNTGEMEFRSEERRVGKE